MRRRRLRLLLPLARCPPAVRQSRPAPAVLGDGRTGASRAAASSVMRLAAAIITLFDITRASMLRTLTPSALSSVRRRWLAELTFVTCRRMSTPIILVYGVAASVFARARNSDLLAWPLPRRQDSARAAAVEEEQVQSHAPSPTPHQRLLADVAEEREPGRGRRTSRRRKTR